MHFFMLRKVVAAGAFIHFVLVLQVELASKRKYKLGGDGVHVSATSRAGLKQNGC